MRDFVSIGADGRFRSSKMERLAEIFEDYDPDLELQWIPPEYRTSDHSPHYRLYHHSSHGGYVVGTFYEYDDPEQVLARFLAGDTRKRDVLAELEAQERAADIFRKKEWLDEYEERKERVKMFVSDRAYFTMRDSKGNLVKYDEERRKRLVK